MPATKQNLNELPLPQWSVPLWSKWTFSWLSPLLKFAKPGPVQQKDLWTIPQDHSASVLTDRLLKNFDLRAQEAREWNARLESGQWKPSALRRSWWRFRSRCFLYGSPDGCKRPSLVGALSATFFYEFWHA